MEFLNIALRELESAFQKHEKEVVSELAVDRILTFIGVHMLLGLGGLFKISEVIGSTFHLFENNIACYPTNNTEKPDRAFMAYTHKYCWEGLREPTSGSVAKLESKRIRPTLQDPIMVKTIFQILPYLFVAEAFLLMLPTLWWHITVGARLTGHLKFILHFMEDLFKALKLIPAGIYRKIPYDKEGKYLDGWQRFDHRYKPNSQGMTSRGKNSQPKQKESANNEESKGSIATKRNFKDVIGILTKAEMKEEDHGNTDEQSQANSKNCKLCGRVKDRHIFSMLCYENFASLSYQPYLMSVIALTSTAAAEGDRSGVVPLKKGILRQFSHEQNFQGKFLAKCYMIKCMVGIILSFIMLTACWGVLFTAFTPTFTTKTFECVIPNYQGQMVCVFKKHWDITALYFINTCLVTAYFALSIYQFYFVRFGSERASCYFFEDIEDSSSVALASAHRAEQDMK